MTVANTTSNGIIRLNVSVSCKNKDCDNTIHHQIGDKSGETTCVECGTTHSNKDVLPIVAEQYPDMEDLISDKKFIRQNQTKLSNGHIMDKTYHKKLTNKFKEESINEIAVLYHEKQETLIFRYKHYAGVYHKTGSIVIMGPKNQVEITDFMNKIKEELNIEIVEQPTISNQVITQNYEKEFKAYDLIEFIRDYPEYQFVSYEPNNFPAIQIQTVEEKNSILIFCSRSDSKDGGSFFIFHDLNETNADTEFEKFIDIVESNFIEEIDGTIYFNQDQIPNNDQYYKRPDKQERRKKLVEEIKNCDKLSHILEDDTDS